MREQQGARSDEHWRRPRDWPSRNNQIASLTGNQPFQIKYAYKTRNDFHQRFRSTREGSLQKLTRAIECNSNRCNLQESYYLGLRLGSCLSWWIAARRSRTRMRSLGTVLRHWVIIQCYSVLMPRAEFWEEIALADKFKPTLGGHWSEKDGSTLTGQKKDISSLGLVVLKLVQPRDLILEPRSCVLRKASVWNDSPGCWSRKSKSYLIL